MELNIYIFLKDKLTAEAELIHVMSDRSNPKAFATPDLPRERDPVVVFKICSEKRPESMNKPDAPFYLGANHTTKNSDKSWFKASAMKTMGERAGLDQPRSQGLSSYRPLLTLSRGR